MKEKDRSFKKRLRALFALSVETRKDKGECPTTAELAALIDGNLNAEKRDALLAHLDACPDCYHEWLAAASMLTENDQALAPAPHQSQGRAGFSAFKSRFSIALAVAASLALLVYVNIFRQPSFPELINQQYQIVMETPKPDTPALPTGQAGGQTSKTVKPVYGFTGSSQDGPSPFAQTFLSGFQTGRTMLEKRTKPFKDMEAEHQAFFWAGRWLALLSYLCDSGETRSKEFWETQHLTTQRLLENFNHHVDNENEAVLLSRSLERIDSSMLRQDQDPCRFIALEIDFIFHGMNMSN